MVGLRNNAVLVFVALAMLLGSACASAGGAERGPAGSKAEAAFNRAEDSFDSGDFIDASARYNAIRSQYPYSRFATLAELRLADAYYEQDKFPAAIQQYRSFIKLHPNHDKVVYAQYRVAESFAGQMPDDWFLLPPSYERDLASTRDAEREFRYFLKKYPDGEFTPDAKKSLARIRRRLADHEFYVGVFYLERDNPRAAAMRFTYLLDKYSGLGLDPNALFLLARASLELGDVKRAKTALDDLVKNFPQHKLASEAQAYLRRHRLASPE